MTDWVKEDLKYIWHPCSQMKDYEELPPIVIDRAEGINLYDIDGNCYKDVVSSWWCNLLGHCSCLAFLGETRLATSDSDLSGRRGGKPGRKQPRAGSGNSDCISEKTTGSFNDRSGNTSLTDRAPVLFAGGCFLEITVAAAVMGNAPGNIAVL